MRAGFINKVIFYFILFYFICALQTNFNRVKSMHSYKNRLDSFFLTSIFASIKNSFIRCNYNFIFFNVCFLLFNLSFSFYAVNKSNSNNNYLKVLWRRITWANYVHIYIYIFIRMFQIRQAIANSKIIFF